MKEKTPYYELDLTTRNRIIGLINQCEISNLGNVSFEYFERPNQDSLVFCMSQTNWGWDLIVIGERLSARDIYKIIDNVIRYDYSEKD